MALKEDLHAKGGGNENENKIDAVEFALPTSQFINVSGCPGAVIPKFESTVGCGSWRQVI